MSLLEVENLTTTFKGQSRKVTAVDNVSFAIRKGETLGLVGESGSGKSVTALSLMRLLPQANGLIESGSIRFDGVEVLEIPLEDMREIRGNTMAIVFQDPMTSLNPVMTVGKQMFEALELHLGLSSRAAWKRSIELLRAVGISGPESRLNDYPHQLSGGMRQRIMIAIAISCNPKLLLADEITTALDVTTQAQILDLLGEITEASSMAVLLITHDLGVVAGLAQRVHVMYGGRIVEKARTPDLFSKPQMPYTWGLLNAIPRLDRPPRVPLQSIPGSPPDLESHMNGCRFAPRCQFTREICREQEPTLTPSGLGSNDHEVRCWGVQSVEGGGWLLDVPIDTSGVQQSVER